MSVVVVGAAPMTEGYLRAAERLGLEVGLVETPERSAELRGRYRCVVDTADVAPDRAGRDDGWIGPAGALVQRLRPDGVLASSEVHVLAAALAQEQYRLPGPGLDAAAISRDKGQQRFRFAAAGLAQPEHRKTRRLSDVAGWAAERFPVVVKPLNRAGSDGVELVADPAAWADALRRRDGQGPLLVEEYVGGQEYSWDGIVVDGKVCFGSLTRKVTTGAPDFVELAHVAAHHRTDPELGEAADALGQAVADAMRIRTGVAFVEFRTRGSDLVIMEAAVRAPGDYCMDATSIAFGTDLYAEVLNLTVGGSFGAPVASGRHAGTCFVVADRPGVLVSAGEDDWLSWPGVVRGGVTARPGAAVGPPQSSLDRVGWAVLDCRTQDELEQLVGRLLAVRPVLA